MILPEDDGGDLDDGDGGDLDDGDGGCDDHWPGWHCWSQDFDYGDYFDVVGLYKSLHLHSCPLRRLW